MDIIEKPASMETMRKAYVLTDEEQHLLEFKNGEEVIPAENYDIAQSIRYFYVKSHEPGSKHWKEGGYECIDSTGAKRAFHLDALIRHPEIANGGKRITQTRRRGRPKMGAVIKLEPIDPNAPKRGRGRPRKDPSELIVKPDYKPTGGKRGRPRKNPEELIVKQYVPTGGKRGRPRKDPNAPIVTKKEYVPTGRKRGRPRKTE